MKKFNKIVSLLLAVIMLLGALSAVMSVNVFAAADDENDDVDIQNAISNKSPEDYTEKIYLNEDAKIASMRLAFRNKGYKIYVDDYSGEVAVVNEKTGEKLFTNPWDVASDKSSNTTTDDSTTGSIKEQILSQIELSFSDITGQNYTYTSFRMASVRNQITVKNIKGGIRVEYTIGREQSKMLAPRYIEASRFEKMIWSKLREVYGSLSKSEQFQIDKLITYYTPVSANYVTKAYIDDFASISDEDEGINAYADGKPAKNESERKKVLDDFPALKNLELMYTISEDISSAELSTLEQIIKTYCPDYSYEELEYDHELTQYEAEDENPPVFKMALEYTIDNQGLSVRLPANGIRFNESLYTLNSLTVLPYMGAGSNWTEGYNFMPDGSGALYEFNEAGTTNSPVSVYNQVYGTDYAYHELSGTYEKPIRYPVFGTVVSSTEYTYTDTNISGDEVITVVDGSLVDRCGVNKANEIYEGLFNTLNPILSSLSKQESIEEKKTGFLAIIEEGDALTKIASYHGGNQNDYNSVKMQFTPRPSDSYNLQESISVSGLGEWTVVSERKYLGSYKMRYIMLSDSENELDSATTMYDASWFGMAVAYRDYLESNDILTPLTEEDIKEDIPLYIESFGSLETVEKILSIPVTRMTALTTFENVEDMYDELYTNGIKNINFKLTGFANGGMYYTVPKNVKFESVVGGKKGFQELLEHAVDMAEYDQDANLGIFPDFDFAYIINESAFDGMSLSKHAAKTIDDRYASKRVYSATQQKYINYYDLIVSPAYFSEFYEKLTAKYLEFDNINGISVGSLGNALNSDFDEDEPYNREDSKKYTIDAFEYLDDNLGGIDIMTSGGNAYTWQYVDHMLDVALDSSRQSRASNAVPFLGVVLHGSIQFAGDPLNMEGDIQYAMLKAIENGASPYFVLSYQNTENLKEDTYLSKYYSIRYDIWKSDLISSYNTLNEVLSDVQDKYIIDHQFTQGERIPDIDEIEADIIDAMEGYIEFEDNYLENLKHEAELALANARKDGYTAEQYALNNILSAIETYEGIESTYESIMKEGGYLDALKNAIQSKNEKRIEIATRNLSNNFIILSGSAYKSMRAVVKAVEDYVTLAETALDTIKDKTDNQYIISEAENRLNTVKDYYGEERLSVANPTSHLFDKKVTLLEEERWVEAGVPTYVYGFAKGVNITTSGGVENREEYDSGKYVYVAGCNERGYDFYEFNTETQEYEVILDINIINAILGTSDKVNLIPGRKAVAGVPVVYSGIAIEMNVYNNGKLMDAEVRYDIENDCFYSEYVGPNNAKYYVYYDVQPSYKSLLEVADLMIESVIAAVEQVSPDMAVSFNEKYQSSLVDTDKNNNDNVQVEETEEDSKYVVENIVIVTYGDKEAYKHVILNYNNFTVKVFFNDYEYTIPGYDFVSIMA